MCGSRHPGGSAVSVPWGIVDSCLYPGDDGRGGGGPGGGGGGGDGCEVVDAVETLADVSQGFLDRLPLAFDGGIAGAMLTGAVAERCWVCWRGGCRA